MKQLKLDTCALDGLENIIKFLESHGIVSEYVNFDGTYSRTIQFIINAQTYQIIWFRNESKLKIGTDKRSAFITFKHIYFDSCHPIVGGNESLAFSYTKKDKTSIFDNEFNYQDFHIPL